MWRGDDALRIKDVASSALTTRQGFPTASTPAGMSRVTTLPAPMVVSSPMVTPGQMIAPPPIHTRLPMVIGDASSGPAVRSAASSG